MNIQITTTDPFKTATPFLAVPVLEFTDKLPRSLAELDQLSGGQVAAATRDFKGKAGESLLLYPPQGPARLLLLGLGPARQVDAEAVRRTAGVAAGRARKLKCASLTYMLPARGKAEVMAQAAAEGVRLGGYIYNRYKTIDPPPDTLKEVQIHTSEADRTKAKKGAERGAITGWGAVVVRDMVNTPAADWTPEDFAKAALRWGKECGFKVTVKGPTELKKEKFGGLLAVGGGSANTPRFIRMDYQGAKGAPTVLVGKGITFDTGGISLKPGADMDQMKGDMAGAAVVLATMATAARLGLKVHLVGLLCTAENMPSGTAYRPGDVVRAHGGKTIEVLNTDAEGRVVLADGLDYAGGLKPRAVIDLATLTGAIIIALGHHTAGVMGTDQKLIDALKRASKATSERVWQMPLDKEHEQLVKSEIADVKNTAGRPASSCTAAAFLKTFTTGYPWAHVDIAGVDLEFKGLDYIPKGPSGFGVRLLIEYLSKLSG